MSEQEFTISELSRRTDFAIDTLRFYEKKGLLPKAKRNASGYRIYAVEDENRLHFIRRAKAMGFSLEEVMDLLRLSGADDAVAGPIREMIRQKINDYRMQIREAEEALKILEPLALSCPGGVTPTDQCPIVRFLEQDEACTGKS